MKTESAPSSTAPSPATDVEATYRQLQQRGVEFVEPPTSQPWGTFAKFKDSEGNVFVLSSS